MSHPGHRFSKAASVLLGGMLWAAIAVPASAQTAPDTGLFMNILPPGNKGFMNSAEALNFIDNGILPDHFDDQRLMYGDLVYAPPGLTNGDLANYFKPAPLGPSDNPPEFISPPIDGVTIIRDAFGIPYIKGKSRRQLMRGIGFAQAQDRLFAMDIARRAGRGRITEFIGFDSFNYDQDEAIFQFSGYDEVDLQLQYDNLVDEYGGRGRRLDRDIEAFVNGINRLIGHINAQPISRAPAEYVGLDLIPIELFTKTDIVAIATQLEFLFGAGGGSEHRNSLFRQEAIAAHGPVDGLALYNDLRRPEEPEASNTTEVSFPYLIQGPIDPAAVAEIDLGSVVQSPILEVTGPLPPPAPAARIPGLSGLSRKNADHPSMSNFLGINGEHAEGGHPIAVMGPQMAYLIPELVTEINIDGAGLRARGAAVIGTPYIVLGRGRSYAWSATAGGSDNTDVRAELLCEPGGGAPSIMSSHYMYNGECIPIFERVDTWCAGDTTFCSMNSDNMTATVQRSVHGIIFARATVGGAPVALARQRSSFFREGQNAVAFMDVNRKTRTFKRFARAINNAPGSFNWLYANEKELGFFHSGRFPIRAEGVDYDMPSWGTGEWEWQGFIDRNSHPQEVNPPKGFFNSWNNKPARDWRSSDSNYGFTSVHRVDSLDDRLEAAIAGGTPISVANMVEMMEDAGTVDLRGAQVLPLALQLIGAEPPLAGVLTVLDDWVTAGAFRRDRDNDGEYDHTSAVAIMDEWYERMIHAAFDHLLGPPHNLYGPLPLGFDDKPGSRGSAYQSGFYGLLQKTFRMALGHPVVGPYSVLTCDDGTAAGCRSALVSSLNDAVAQLTADFGSADPADWSVDPTSEQIEFQPFGLAEVDPIHWINRPTFQQVVQVTSRRAPKN